MLRALTKRGWSGHRVQVLEPADPPRRSSKKDTRRWCRGRVGIDHHKRWTIKRGILTWNVEACSACGREFRTCSAFMGGTPCVCGSCSIEHRPTLKLA